MSLFTKNPVKVKEDADYKVKRANQLSTLNDLQLIMYALNTMVDGYVMDEQISNEIAERCENVLPRLEE